MSSPAKFKYRIRIGKDVDYPYCVDKKGFLFWSSVGKHKSKSSAESQLQECVRLEVLRPGTILKEYTEQDYLADKLKGYD